MSQFPYLNPDLSIESRVDDLLARMTLPEKVGQLIQYFYHGDAIHAGSEVTTEQSEILQQVALVEEEVRTGRAGSVLFVHDAATTNRLQRLAVENSRLRIPLIFAFDVIHGFHTVFPVPIAVAASWRPDNATQAQAVAAREARAVGIHWAFAPMVDIARDPRWGRMVEGAGEDPVLASAFAAAQVRGFQGNFGAENVISGPKHFAGYGAARGGRDYEESDISDSEFYNVYLPPFRAAIDAGAANIMSAYMELNGIPAAGNRWLLNDLLRGELGFEGFVVSDANAVRSLETQHLAENLADAGARALNAGVDVEMTMGVAAYGQLLDALRTGGVDATQIDTSVRRVLRAKFALGLFESVIVDESNVTVVHTYSHHSDVARSTAHESIVLLKNDGILPLDSRVGQKVAVIGQLAASKRDTLGPWIFAQKTDDTVTVLEGLRSRLGDEGNVSFAPGAAIPVRVFPSIFEGIDPSVGQPDGWDDDAEIDRAVELARDADVAIVVVGQRQEQIGENASTSTLALPGRQLEQLQRIHETGTPVVLLVMSGRPLELEWAADHLPAMAQIWYPGSRGGDAVAAILVGDESPAGRLPFTWPKHVGQIPANYSHYRTFAPANASSRYFNETSAPLYPFGHGLSYATFEYKNLLVEPGQISTTESATVSVTVTNTSNVDSDEVAQLYIHQRFGRSVRPVRELKGFTRLRVPARCSQVVTFSLGPDELRYWSADGSGWAQDRTTFDIWVGGDSQAALASQLVVR